MLLRAECHRRIGARGARGRHQRRHDRDREQGFDTYLKKG